MAYVSSEDRRAQAREVALRHMRAGARYEDLSLRDIAKELGVALSTLTYAYQSIGDLMDDFDLVFHSELMPLVGSGGLREELRRYVEGTYRMVAGDPALAEISRYRFARIGDGHHAARLAGTLELFTVIRRRGRENYRLPDDLMAELFYAQISGAFAVWFDTHPDVGSEAGVAWYRWMIAAIDVLTIAADPRPIGQPHTEPPFPFPDYALLEPPAVDGD
jgi:AcrR family transcriptional regulator